MLVKKVEVKMKLKTELKQLKSNLKQLKSNLKQLKSNLTGDQFSQDVIMKMHYQIPNNIAFNCILKAQKHSSIQTSQGLLSLGI